MAKSADLTTLSGWGALADGDHTITVVAKADGYIDSEPSAGVTVTKGQSEDALAGTWVFNNTLDFSSLGLSQDDSISWSVNFTPLNFDSASNAPNRIKIYYGIIGLDDKDNEVIGYNLDYPYVPSVGLPEPFTVYHSIYADGFVGWAMENLKTIIITSKLSEVTNGDNLLAWLQANATKQ